MPKKRRNKKKRISKKNINNNENNDNDEINNNNNDEINDDEIKITNIDYEKYIKKNELLYDYISNSKSNLNHSLVITSNKFNEDIYLKNNSLIKIIKQAELDKKLKIYITFQITSENIEFETLSRKSFSFNPRTVNYIKNKNHFYINKEICINKNTLEKIFNLIGINNYEEIINYIEFTVTEIFYQYEKSHKLYKIKTGKNIHNFLKNNKIFYIQNNNNNIEIPLLNYSINKIFNLINDNINNINNKYLLINYKIKKEKEKNENYDLYINKLINASDIKNIHLKYKTKTENNTLNILSNKNIERINILNITQNFNNNLIAAEDLLSNILSKISSKKEEIFNLCENINNQFIKINNNNNNDDVYIKRQQNINKENYDDDDDDIYIEIEYDKKKYLCKKNKILKIYDSWKILKQKELFDVIDNNDFTNKKINIELLNLKIIQQNNDIKVKNKINLYEYIQTLPKKKVFNIKYKVKVQKIPKNNNI